MSNQKPKKSQRIKHRQGLNDFLALGPDRSLDKLHQWYTKNVSKPPGRSIIGIWSMRYDWQTRAAQHDERVAGGVSEKVEAAAIEENWDSVKDLSEVAQKSIQKALDALEGDNMEAKDPYAVAALMNTALGSIKAVELLSGRATGRFENAIPKDHAPEWMETALATTPAATSNDETAIPETATQH